MTELDHLLVDLFHESVAVFARPEPVYWKDPQGFQEWARARRLFSVERGVRLTAPDDSTAGRKQFSRLKLEAEQSGMVWITRIGPTSQFLALTPGGLLVASLLTGKWPPRDLWKATKALADEGKQS